MTEPTPPADPAGVVGWVDPVHLAEGAIWANELDPDDLQDALEAAHEQCLEYLNHTVPTNPDGSVPKRLILAQKMQARALIRAGVTGADDSQGMDGMSVTVFPMDWTVKNLLRPQRPRIRGPQ